MAASLLVLLYFSTQCVLAHVPEANLWSERRRRVQQTEGRDADALVMANLSQKSSFDASFFQPPVALEAQLKGFVLPTHLLDNVSKPVVDRLSPVLAGLPAGLGTVRKVTPAKDPIVLEPGQPVYQADLSYGAPIVLHIQDVHMNAEAQRHIAQAVAALVKNQTADLVALEGAFGPVGLKPYHDFPDQDHVRWVADCLLRESDLSGAMHAGLTTPGPAPFIGVDEPEAYRANVEAYQHSRRMQKSYKTRAARRDKRLQSQAVRLLNPDLAKFHDRVRAYRSGVLPLRDYVQTLARQDGAGLSDAGRAFLAALRAEDRLNFRRLEQERKELAQRLAQTLKAADLTALVKASVACQAGLISQAAFQDRLKTICHAARIKLEEFPETKAYMAYVDLSEKIDGQALFDALRGLEERAYDRLIQTTEERDLLRRERRLYLTGKLLDFALTRQDWQDYKALSTAQDDPDFFPKDLSSFEAFYEQALRRDEALVWNLRKAMAARNTPVAVLVTGGFHSEAIERRLSNAGATVVTWAPKISKVDTEAGASYLNLFAQEKTPIERLFEGQRLFLALPQGTRAQDLLYKALIALQDPVAADVRLQALKPPTVAHIEGRAMGPGVQGILRAGGRRITLTFQKMKEGIAGIRQRQSAWAFYGGGAAVVLAGLLTSGHLATAVMEGIVWTALGPARHAAVLLSVALPFALGLWTLPSRENFLSALDRVQSLLQSFVSTFSPQPLAAVGMAGFGGGAGPVPSVFLSQGAEESSAREGDGDLNPREMAAAQAIMNGIFEPAQLALVLDTNVQAAGQIRNRLRERMNFLLERRQIPDGFRLQVPASMGQFQLAIMALEIPGVHVPEFVENLPLFAGLSEQQRRVFSLYAEQGLTDAQMAQALETSQAKVRGIQRDVETRLGLHRIPMPQRGAGLPRPRLVDLLTARLGRGPALPAPGAPGGAPSDRPGRSSVWSSADRFLAQAFINGAPIRSDLLWGLRQKLGLASGTGLLALRNALVAAEIPGLVVRPPSDPWWPVGLTDSERQALTASFGATDQDAANTLGIGLGDYYSRLTRVRRKFQEAQMPHPRELPQDLRDSDRALLQAILEGRTDEELAQQLDVQPRTAGEGRRELARRLGIGSSRPTLEEWTVAAWTNAGMLPPGVAEPPLVSPGFLPPIPAPMVEPAAVPAALQSDSFDANERDMMRLIVEGITARKELANRLGLSRATADRVLARIKGKFGLGNERNLGLLRRAIEAANIPGIEIAKPVDAVGVAGLSAREREVFDLTLQGLTLTEIARQIRVSDAAVKLYLLGARAKFEKAGLEEPRPSAGPTPEDFQLARPALLQMVEGALPHEIERDFDMAAVMPAIRLLSPDRQLVTALVRAIDLGLLNNEQGAPPDTPFVQRMRTAVRQGLDDLEFEILTLAARGMRSGRIGETLFLNVDTMGRRLRALREIQIPSSLEDPSLDTTTAMVLWAAEQGIVEETAFVGLVRHPLARRFGRGQLDVLLLAGQGYSINEIATEIVVEARSFGPNFLMPIRRNLGIPQFQLTRWVDLITVLRWSGLMPGAHVLTDLDREVLTYLGAAPRGRHNDVDVATALRRNEAYRDIDEFLVRDLRMNLAQKLGGGRSSVRPGSWPAILERVHELGLLDPPSPEADAAIARRGGMMPEQGHAMVWAALLLPVAVSVALWIVGFFTGTLDAADPGSGPLTLPWGLAGLFMPGIVVPPSADNKGQEPVDPDEETLALMQRMVLEGLLPHELDIPTAIDQPDILVAVVRALDAGLIRTAEGPVQETPHSERIRAAVRHHVDQLTFEILTLASLGLGERRIQEELNLPTRDFQAIWIERLNRSQVPRGTSPSARLRALLIWAADQGVVDRTGFVQMVQRPAAADFTQQELEVIWLMASGFSESEITTELGMDRFPGSLLTDIKGKLGLPLGRPRWLDVVRAIRVSGLAPEASILNEEDIRMLRFLETVALRDQTDENTARALGIPVTMARRRRMLLQSKLQGGVRPLLHLWAADTLPVARALGVWPEGPARGSQDSPSGEANPTERGEANLAAALALGAVGLAVNGVKDFLAMGPAVDGFPGGAAVILAAALAGFITWAMRPWVWGLSGSSEKASLAREPGGDVSPVPPAALLAGGLSEHPEVRAASRLGGFPFRLSKGGVAIHNRLLAVAGAGSFSVALRHDSLGRMQSADLPLGRVLVLNETFGQAALRGNLEAAVATVLETSQADTSRPVVIVADSEPQTGLVADLVEEWRKNRPHASTPKVWVLDGPRLAFLARSGSQGIFRDLDVAGLQAAMAQRGVPVHAFQWQLIAASGIRPVWRGPEDGFAIRRDAYILLSEFLTAMPVTAINHDLWFRAAQLVKSFA